MEFDLQLFAEEGGEAVANDTATVATDSTPASEAPAPQATSEPTETSVPPVAVTKDEMGRRRVVFPQDETSDTAESTVATTNEPAAPPQPQQYTASELFEEIALGHNVDESRIPQELANDYAAIRQQQMNNVNQQQAQAVQQAQQTTDEQPKQMSEAEIQARAQQAQLEAYKQIRQMAEDKAKADLGISDEDIEDAEYSDDEDIQLKVQAYQQAVQMNMNLINQQIANNRAQQQAIEMQRQQETQEAMAVIAPKWQEYQKDPHYNEIDAMMEHYYETLPYTEAVKVKASIDRLLSGRPVKADYDILNNYYLKTKEAYYAKKTGVGTKPQPAHRAAPPYVEPTGQNSTGTVHKGVDWTRMRTMTPAQRSQFFRDNFC